MIAENASLASPAIPQTVRSLIYNTLCLTNQLSPSHYPLTETPLYRQGTLCGYLFCLYGPRKLRPTAIWDPSENTVVFYNGAGERYLTLATPPLDN